ncbi:MAG: Rrf2 family transcriptional regulator [Candidatus Aminicenantes bacterium]|nr:Rrf2 family transcriptional regulator [Candidatus Aminicenantes bacterium]
MDMIRRNTDYALRLMMNLAGRFGKGAVSSRVLSEKEEVSYQLTCKLLQRLNAAGLVKSQMGPTGGFFLGKAPSEIKLAAIVEVIQGPVIVNRCLFGIDVCSRQPDCPISKKLAELQEYIEFFFNDITLAQLLKSWKSHKEIKKKNKKEKK